MKDYIVNNFKAINYQYAVGQFSTCIDLEECSFETMMFEKYPSISPYTYCANNPVMFVDPTGRYYIKPPSKNNSTRYKAMVTNYKWVNLVSKMTAIPYLGLMYEGMLGIQRAKDPSFDITTNDIIGYGLQFFGLGSLKLLTKLAKIEGLGKFLLNLNRQAASSMFAALSEPETKEMTIDYLAIKVLEEEGMGKIYGYGDNLKEYTFSFYESVTNEIKKDILSDKNLTSQKDFNIEKEVTKRLEIIIDNKKEKIRKTLTEE
ncbi:MAG: hypothetical protein PHI52_08125 [Bacteroidales bacterium]|nr:hypothetical protein [Bacteroidales bacterium]